MPSPSTANTSSACEGGSTIASPSDAPMKGAVHGEAIAARPALREAAARVRARLAATWRRLNGTLQLVRCMVGLLGSLQT